MKDAVFGLVLFGAVAGLALSGGAARAQDAQPTGPCAPNTAVEGGNDQQPTDAEIAARAANPDCGLDGKPLVDTSNKTGKEVDQMYDQLMKQADEPDPLAGGAPADPAPKPK